MAEAQIGGGSSDLLGRLQSLVDGLAAEADQPCDGGDGLALGVKLADQGFLLHRQADASAGLPAAPAFALGLGPGDAGQLSFLAHLGLILADAGQHHQHQLCRTELWSQVLPN